MTFSATTILALALIVALVAALAAWAYSTANRLDRLHVRSDLERKALAGVDDTERLPAASYTQASSDAVYARLMQRAGYALAAGRDVVVDAVCLQRRERQQLAELAARHGASFAGLWLQAPLAVLQARVTARRGDASDATAEVVSRQAAQAEQAAAGGLQDMAREPGWHRLEAGRDALATLVAARCALRLE